jgi:hypothetical protein
MKQVMKTRFAIIIALVALASSCTKEVVLPMDNNDVKTCSVSASIAGATKALQASVLKSSWNANDRISLLSNNSNSYFVTSSEGTQASFTLYDGNNNLANGTVYAEYPVSGILSGNGHTFSLEFQNGSADQINKYSLMTAVGQAVNGNASLTFENRLAVINLKNVQFPSVSKSIKNIKVSGEGIASVLNVKADGNAIAVSAANEESIVINAPATSEDRFLGFEEDGDYNFYVVIPATAAKTLTVTATDALNNSFTCTVDCNEGFANGQMYTVSDITLDAKLAINFSASVNDWKE